MRIGYFLPRCTPENSHGRYVIELAGRLAREHSVTVYAGRTWPPLRTMVQCRSLPVPNRPAIARLAGLWVSSIVARKRSFDIVHIQGADAPVGNVVTAHFCNSTVRQAARRYAGLYRRFNNALGEVAERFCMSKSSTKRIIAVSRMVKSEIVKEYGVNPNNIVVISDGVDLAAFNPGLRTTLRRQARVHLGLEEEDFVVLFVGGDYRRKGLVTLLEALERVARPMKVLSVGMKPDSALVRFIRRVGLSDLVRFVDSTPDIASMYAVADCFALPTRYDTFSMATLEAMASGVPVVVSAAAGITEHLTDGLDSVILREPGDVESLVKHLDRLGGDDVFRSRLSERGRETAERFSWDNIAEQTLEVYRQVI